MFKTREQYLQAGEGIEPDARELPCESCGKHGVFGAEQILLEFGR
jgi:hypothetical protein